MSRAERPRRAWLSAPVLLALAACLPVAAAPAGPPAEAEAWLARMVEAIHGLDYRARLVRLDSFRFDACHAYRDSIRRAS